MESVLYFWLEQCKPRIIYWMQYCESFILENFCQNYVFFVGLFLLYVSGFLFLYCSICSGRTKLKNDITSKQRILFVISHPDDECMFFGPAISKLTRAGNDVFLLCLSYGDYYQQGRLRKNELWRSCSILGIPESNIIIKKISALKDDPNISWNEQLLTTVICNHVELLHIDAVLTFDQDGVSGHANHKSVYYGMAKAIVENNDILKNCSVFCLDSVFELRKYSFMLDLLISFWFCTNLFILTPFEKTVVQNAMAAHKTQYVWFRKIYIMASRYVYINSYTQLSLKAAKIELKNRRLDDLASDSESGTEDEG